MRYQWVVINVVVLDVILILDAVLELNLF